MEYHLHNVDGAPPPKRAGWRSKSRRIALPHGRSRRMQSRFACPRYPSGISQGEPTDEQRDPNGLEPGVADEGGLQVRPKHRTPPYRGRDQVPFAALGTATRSAVERRRGACRTRRPSLQFRVARAWVAITGANA